MGLFNVLSLAIKYGSGAFVTYWLLVFSYRLLLHPLRKYPGPFAAKLSGVYGGYHALRTDLHLVTVRNHKQYGPVFRQGPDRLMFSSIEAMREIYDNSRLVKSPVYVATLGYTGTFNVFSAIEKHVHRAKRQLVGAALTDRAMRQFEPTMATEIDVFLRQLLKSAHDSNPVNVTERCRNLTMDVIGQLSFGYPLKTQTESTCRFIREGISAGNAHNNILFQFPRIDTRFFTYPLHILTTGPRQKAFDFVENMINERVSEGKDARRDFYAQVIDQLPKNADLRHSEIWSESLLLIAAGGDTTGTGLTAVFFYMSQTPGAYSTLTEEIRSTFSSGREIRSGPKLSSCKYLRASIDEALRMSPPIPGTLWRRQAADDEEPLIVDGHVIPRGIDLCVSTYALHHNPDYFPDPYAYRPERWLEADVERKHTMNKAFAPFSIGYRSCAGKAVAYMEMTLTVAKTFFYFDFERAPGKAGRLGVGTPGSKNGRGRTDEFQIFDTFVSTHDGPNVIFRPRGESWNELVD